MADLTVSMRSLLIDLRWSRSVARKSSSTPPIETTITDDNSALDRTQIDP